MDWVSKQLLGLACLSMLHLWTCDVDCCAAMAAVQIVAMDWVSMWFRGLAR